MVFESVVILTTHYDFRDIFAADDPFRIDVIFENFHKIW